MMENDAFCSRRLSPFVNAFGADFLHFNIFAILHKEGMTAWPGPDHELTVFFFWSTFFWSTSILVAELLLYIFSKLSTPYDLSFI